MPREVVSGDGEFLKTRTTAKCILSIASSFRNACLPLRRSDYTWILNCSTLDHPLEPECVYCLRSYSCLSRRINLALCGNREGCSSLKRAWQAVDAAWISSKIALVGWGVRTWIVGDLKVIFRNNNRDIVVWRHQPCRNAKQPFCHVVDRVLKCFSILLQRADCLVLRPACCNSCCKLRPWVQSKALNESWLISRVERNLIPC